MSPRVKNGFEVTTAFKKSIYVYNNGALRTFLIGLHMITLRYNSAYPNYNIV